MFARHVTLEADTVLEVTLDARYAEVEVLVRAAAAEVYFTVNGATPTVEGDNTFVVPAVIAAREAGAATRPAQVVHSGDPFQVVKLISSGSPGVSVTAVKEWEDAD